MRTVADDINPAAQPACDAGHGMASGRPTLFRVESPPSDGSQHRAVLVLRDLEGMDEQAAAAALDVPLGTVRSRLSRARRTFRKAWEQ